MKIFIFTGILVATSFLWSMEPKKNLSSFSPESKVNPITRCRKFSDPIERVKKQTFNTHLFIVEENSDKKGKR